MCTHNIPFFLKKRENTPDYFRSAVMGFFLGTQGRVRHSHGKQAISVRATEVLLYVFTFSPSSAYSSALKEALTANEKKCLIMT